MAIEKQKYSYRKSDLLIKNDLLHGHVNMTIIFSTEKTLALHFTINNILQKIVTNATTIEIQQKKHVI